MTDRIPVDVPPGAAVVPPSDGGARTVSSETGGGGGAERRVSEFAGSPENNHANHAGGEGGVGHGENHHAGGDGGHGLPHPSPAAAASAAARIGGDGSANAAVPPAGGSGNYLVSETEDNYLDENHPTNADEAAAATVETEADEAKQADAADGEDGNDGEEDDDDDESDYSYEYEYEDDHYGGFIVEADHAAIPHAVSATASADGDHAASSPANAATAQGLGGARGGSAEEDGAAVAGAAAAGAGAGEASSASTGGGGPNGGSSANGSLLAPVSLAPPRKSKWRDPSREAVNMSLRAEKETTGGKRRLASDLYKIMMNDTDEAGYDIEPKSEDSMDTWTIRLFGFDTDSNLHQDMMILGLDHIELEMSFPDQYPFAPPFVRVVRPRFKRQTGFVMNGALCMELLTSDGWNPVNDIESVIVSIRSLLVVGDGRLEAAVKFGPEQRKKLLAEAQARLEKKKSGDDDDDDDDASDEGSRKRPRDSDASDGADSKKKAKGDGKGGDDDSKEAGVSKTAAGSYSTAEAKSAYQHLTDFHKKKGWDQSGWWSRRG